MPVRVVLRARTPDADMALSGCGRGDSSRKMPDCEPLGKSER